MSNAMMQETLLPFHILFTCPHCKAVRQVPEQYIGLSGPCNTCGGTITISAAASPALPPVSIARPSKEWYRERIAYFEFCRDHYERARAQFPPIVNDAYWQRGIQEAANCPDRLEQVARWEKLVVEGIPWAVAFEYLVHHYAKEKVYDKAYYFCCVYFQSDRWRNPQCANSSYKLLKLMRKLDQKLHGE